MLLLQRTLRALLLLACAATAGCAADRPAGVPLASVAGTWILAELADAPTPLSDEARPRLTISAMGELSGFAGVNRFHGALDAGPLAQGRFEAGPLTTTRMAGPPEAMALEQRFLEVLGAAETCRLDEDELRLLRGEETLARLLRAR